MAPAICFIQGALEVASLAGFLAGYFGAFWPLMVFCGILMLLDDAYQILSGIINPIFPIVYAIILAMIFDPWYVGVFLSMAAFKMLGMPNAAQKILTPRKLTRQLEQRMMKREF